MNLYEINDMILNCFDQETGEIYDIDALKMEREEKIENIALFIKNLLAEADALKHEKEAFAEREKAVKNKAENLKKYLSDSLNGDKFNTPKVSISFCKSNSVECLDSALIPKDYLRYKEPELDKTKIKNALKSGEAVPGCLLVTNQNIQIK